VIDRIKYWVDLSDYDLDTADAMLSTERFLYVGFMCHQAVEKILKAHFCLSSNEPPPFSHNLSYIAGKSGIDKILNDDYRNLLNILEPLNIEARYPTYKEMLLKSLSKAKCEEILMKTKEVQLWIKERL
jgi:HEPN domain-containing protein